MCQSKVLLGLGWILCFTSFASFMVEAGLLTERKVRQDTLSRICEDGCSPGQQVNEDCCKGSKCTESEYCQDCVGETYSQGGRHDICQSCTICPANADELKKCTKERDAQCQCMLNYFKSPSEQCLHCNTCTGEAYCKDVCSSTPPPNNPSTTTNQPSKTTGTGVRTITPPTSVTPTSLGMITSSSSVFSTAVLQVDPETKRCIEKLECIIPVIIVVILVILIITIISWSYCLSQECKEFLAGCFPCCHGFRSFEGSSPRSKFINL
ncbi:tumor necrosis factor receptor superfamily member 10C-like [Anneissia japonica]|uniref:tumor necrosis factor receptor superfamily member 10C-like n=1 Tax=Anneissia japonica TaxID=1529436 RepID=UPI0014257B0B|nr:tumor necrosis factor receptor superfamily member 10C-like [Anneissia japonica]